MIISLLNCCKKNGLLILVFLAFLGNEMKAQVPSTLYAGYQGFSGTPSQIDLIDTAGLAFSVTSSITVTSTFGPVQGVYGISQHPSTGDVYLLYQSTGGAGARRLGILDLNTNVIADIGNSGNLTDITFTPDGTLYGVIGNFGATHDIVTINLTTAATTFFISPASGDWGNTLGYDPYSDELIHLCQPNHIDKINYSASTQTTLNATSPPGETQAVAILNSTTAWVQNYNRLYELNTQTGAYNLVNSNVGRYHAFGFIGAPCSETTSSFSQTACGSYVVPSGDETYTSSGTYMDTIANSDGCDSVMTITVTITPLDNAGFNYGAASYCVDATNPSPTITGLPGGAFTSSPAGLIINGSSGEIDIASSTPGNYTVTYTTSGTCPNSSNVSVTINALPTVSYVALADLCLNDGVQAGLGGGTPTGGVYSGTGVTDDGNGMTYSFDPSVAGIGTHTITYAYTDVNGCANNNSDNVEVLSLPSDPVVTTPITSCSSQDVILTGTGSGTGDLVFYDNTFSEIGRVTMGGVTTQNFNLGPLANGSYTYYVTEDNGSCESSNVSIAVTVEDNVNPSAVCQNISVYLNASGNVSITAADLDGGSTDNCGTVSLSASMTSFTCANLGANNVVLTVTDGDSNTDNCTAVVTVLDTIAPVITCPGNQTENPDLSCNFTLPDYTGLVTVTDNCTASSVITQSPVAGTVIAGTTTITMTADDGNGNTSTCTFNVILNDAIAPNAVCQNINAYLDGSGNATIVASDLDGGSTDNCSGLVFGASQTAFTCADLGANNVIFTATDGNANTDNCTAVVTVLDTVSPVATCQNVTVFLDGSGNATITSSDIDNGSTDNCGVASLVASKTAFTCADLGANNVTLRVTDGSANVDSCIAVVTVVDTIAPIVVCQNINVYVDNSGSVTIQATDLDGGTTDNCGSVTLSASVTSFNCSQVGANNVTLTGTDGNGNTSNCIAVVTVIDTISPTAVCQNINAYLDNLGNATIAAQAIDGGSSDNCSGVSFSASITSFTCSNLGANNVTLTVTDGVGNTDNCTAVVTVLDTLAPIVTCPGDQTENPDALCNFVLPDYTGLASATDNCSSSPVLTQSPAIGSTISGTTTVTITADDGNGNTSTCTFNVILQDVIPPTISCPGDQNVDLSTACDYTLIDYTGLATVTDNCSGISISQSPAVGTIITATTTVTLTATDGAGNTANCTFDVIPTDNLAPSIVCLGDQSEFVDANCGFTVPDYTALVTATDNCSSNITLSQSPVAGTVVGVGTQVITITGTDANGNAGNCTFNLNVADSIIPTITCPVDQVDSFDGNCEFTLLDYTALAIVSDNCGAPVVTQSPVVGTVVTANTLITLTVDDGNGNTVNCSFNLSLNDTTKPVVNCLADEAIYLDENCQVLLPDYTQEGTIYDNCDDNLSISQTPSAGSVYEKLDTVAVTLIAEDASGNIDSCTFNVRVDADANSGCIDDLIVSDLITPNGDGKNDQWIINEAAYIEGCQVIVYNRWGKQVFESINYDNTWEGTYMGKPLPDGAYYYVILCGGEVKYKGDLSILKLKK
ncbi:MAG: HYR domain-containing protein [Flavobacteriales bacterium]|jgi:gliding motility-associated-like protein|nr:HYR domain-containing protein [Flavobacteriales bacterium]